MLPGISQSLLQTSVEPHDSRHSSTGFYANGVSNRPQRYDKNSPIVHTGPEDPRPFTSQDFALTLAYVGVHLVILTARIASKTTRPKRASSTGNTTRHVVTLTNNAKLKPNPSTRIHARSPNRSSMAEVLTLCISLLPLDVLLHLRLTHTIVHHLCVQKKGIFCRHDPSSRYLRVFSAAASISSSIIFFNNGFPTWPSTFPAIPPNLTSVV
jgi:hypothetical protein